MWDVGEAFAYLAEHWNREWVAFLSVTLGLLVVLLAFVTVIKGLWKQLRPSPRSPTFKELQEAVQSIGNAEREFVFLVLYGWLYREFRNVFKGHGARNTAHRAICELAGISIPQNQLGELETTVLKKLEQEKIQPGSLQMDALKGHLPKSTPILDLFVVSFAMADPSPEMKNALQQIVIHAKNWPSRFTPLMLERVKDAFGHAIV